MVRIDLSPVQFTYEIYIEDKLVSKQNSVAPMAVHRAQYMDLIRQMMNDKRPMCFKMIEPIERIWDEFEQKEKFISNYIEYKNNAYLDKYGRE